MDRRPSMDEHLPQVEQEQIRVLYRHYPLLLLVNAALALAVLGVFHELAGASPMLLWYALFTLVLAMRYRSYRGFHRQSDPQASPWGRRFIAWTALTGLLWGLGAVWIYAQSAVDHRFFILFILMGLGAGAFTSLTAWLPAFHAFIIPTIMPLALTLLLHQDTTERIIGVVCILYVAGLSFFARNLNQTLLESLALRNQNVSLVEELRRQKEQAEKANHNKSRFLAAASHDLRQPLHALSLFIESLRKANRQPELEQTLVNTEASAANLRDLFNRLLDISRLDAGVLQPAIRDFRLQPLLQRLDHDCRPTARERGLSLEISHEDHWVRSDPLLLEQILRNLLSNALRYTSVGGVSLRCLKAPGRITLDVVDSGCGIPAERQQEIFGEFVRLDTGTTDGKGGLGLGLAIVERLAGLLAHPLALVSIPGRGSVFSLTLPCGSARSGTPADTGPEPWDRLTGLRVLVVEDDPAVAEATGALLREWGCRPQVTTSAELALKACSGEERPGLILADYRLGDTENGVAMVRSLRRRLQREVPAAILTGDTAPSVLREVKAAGLPLLHKPVQPAALRALVRNLTRRG